MSDVFSSSGVGIVLLFMAAATAFWIWMLIDCVARSFTNQLEKIAWVVSMLFFHFIISVVYFFVVKRANPTGVVKTP